MNPEMMSDEIARLQHEVFFLKRKLEQENKKYEELNRDNMDLRLVLCAAESALKLISSPMRSDGTWNRSRETCQKLAKETVSLIEEYENNH